MDGGDKRRESDQVLMTSFERDAAMLDIGFIP